MIKRKVAGSLIAATALLGLGVSTSLVADAADTQIAADTAGVEATPSGSAVTKDVCSWYVGGVSSTLTLAPAENATYDGSQLELSSANAESQPSSISAYANASTEAGTASAHTDCTWFSDAQRKGTSDSGMGFTLDGTNTLSAGFTKGTCNVDGSADTSKWTTSAFTVGATASVSADVFKIAASDVTTKPGTASSKGDSCSQSQTWVVKIPGGMKPASPKATYTFTGPKVTTALTLTSVAG
ncbi:MAG: hypothetical protein RL129_1448 [Actinomycetota bacterium]